MNRLKQQQRREARQFKQAQRWAIIPPAMSPVTPTPYASRADRYPAPVARPSYPADDIQ